MELLFTKCCGKRTVLVSPDEICEKIAMGKKGETIMRFEITKKQLESRMKNLVLDGYIDYSNTADKGGNNMYVVTLTTRGEAFRREQDERVKNRLKQIGWRVILTIIGVVVGFGFTKIMGW